MPADSGDECGNISSDTTDDSGRRLNYGEVMASALTMNKLIIYVVVMLYSVPCFYLK